MKALNKLMSICPRLLVNVFYGNVFKLKNSLNAASNKKGIFYGMKSSLYYAYLDSYGSWIGIDSQIQSPPIFPHGVRGIFISNDAVIGENVVIFHQVTIGSNMLPDSKGAGAPTVGNNVYIGCGAKIIGNLSVGNNCRIGANCVVVKDLPENSVAVLGGVRIIEKDNVLNNTYIKKNHEI